MLPAREVDRRKDWIEKTTTGRVRDYDAILIEDVKVKNLVWRRREPSHRVGEEATASGRTRIRPGSRASHQLHR